MKNNQDQWNRQKKQFKKIKVVVESGPFYACGSLICEYNIELVKWTKEKADRRVWEYEQNIFGWPNLQTHEI